ncbi:porin family protein [Roseivirga sp.]|uniref:porin family protein n=1 Tax=Roseivirga sp. TaxID=1964215 RepID=UPI003B520613
MMKRIFLLLLCCGVFNTMMAQNGAFGPRVSLLSNELSVSDNVNNVSSGDAEFGYQFGVFARLGLGKSFMLMPEVLFSDTQATITSNNTRADLDFNQINVPVNFGIKILFLRVQAGPSFNFLTKAESDINGTIQDVKDNYKSATVGYQVGVGMDLLNFLALDLKYDGALSDINEGGAGGFSADQRQKMLVFAVGIKLISGKNKDK